MNSSILKMLCLILLLCYLTKGNVSKKLKYYEILHTDNLQHKTVKRGLQDNVRFLDKIKEISFKTLGKQFRLVLSPIRGIIHSTFKAYAIDGDGNETPIHFNRENFYLGRVLGENISEAHMHIDENGLITGTIHLPEDTYYIEPSWRHLPNSKDNRTMITYKGSDLKFSWDDYYSRKHTETYEYVKRENDLEEKRENDEKNNNTKENVRKTRFYDKKIFVSYAPYTPIKTKCPLLLVADYRYYKVMGDSNATRTVNYFISLMDQIDKMFSDTVWDDPKISGGYKGMGFVLKKIIVHTEPTQVRSGKVHYNMARESWDERNLLEVFSRQKINKNFCLAHLFTHQGFNSNNFSIMGISFPASPRMLTAGGICTLDYFKNGFTLYPNTGLSTALDRHGELVFWWEVILITAHELGHNWGALEDEDSVECSTKPSQGGSYLMGTSGITFGLDKNNYKFSSCSIKSIITVLQVKSSRCFIESEGNYCGNLRVEDGEECDVGLWGVKGNDACCDKNCKLKRNMGAQCCDVNSPCCLNCRYKFWGEPCYRRNSTMCEMRSMCTGKHAECPVGMPIPNCMRKNEYSEEEYKNEDQKGSSSSLKNIMIIAGIIITFIVIGCIKGYCGYSKNNGRN